MNLTPWRFKKQFESLFPIINQLSIKWKNNCIVKCDILQWLFKCAKATTNRRWTEKKKQWEMNYARCWDSSSDVLLHKTVGEQKIENLNANWMSDRFWSSNFLCNQLTIYLPLHIYKHYSSSICIIWTEFWIFIFTSIKIISVRFDTFSALTKWLAAKRMLYRRPFSYFIIVETHSHYHYIAIIGWVLLSKHWRVATKRKPLKVYDDCLWDKIE